jgi:hypothetical protein
MPICKRAAASRTRAAEIGVWVDLFFWVVKMVHPLQSIHIKNIKRQSVYIFFLLINNTRETAYIPFSLTARLSCMFCIRRPFHTFHSNNTAS